MPSTKVADTNQLILWMPAPQFLNWSTMHEDWVESSSAAKKVFALQTFNYLRD
jgi:hypothetical protein